MTNAYCIIHRRLGRKRKRETGMDKAGARDTSHCVCMIGEKEPLGSFSSISVSVSILPRSWCRHCDAYWLISRRLEMKRERESGRRDGYHSPTLALLSLSLCRVRRSRYLTAWPVLWPRRRQEGCAAAHTKEALWRRTIRMKGGGKKPTRFLGVQGGEEVCK